jgi:hypothetical protein
MHISSISYVFFNVTSVVFKYFKKVDQVLHMTCVGSERGHEYGAGSAGRRVGVGDADVVGRCSDDAGARVDAPENGPVRTC